jgi:hypothetical protein
MLKARRAASVLGSPPTAADAPRELQDLLSA